MAHGYEQMQQGGRNKGPDTTAVPLGPISLTKLSSALSRLSPGFWPGCGRYVGCPSCAADF